MQYRQVLRIISVPDVIGGGIYESDSNTAVTEYSTTNPMPNIITINSNEYIEFNLGSDVYRLISPGFNLAFTEKESEPFHWTPDLHLTTIDENIATVEMNGTVARNLFQIKMKHTAKQHLCSVMIIQIYHLSSKFA